MELTTGAATYSPEDNKLRLYVGRVSREEFLKLKADGWICTPKQRENGGCDFVATWTPSRRDTALAYGDGVIEDEDQPMAERAADRAERFGGYRDKRTDEATDHADRYDAGAQAHGYQNAHRAERAAARHDRIADRSCDAWSKAEYWQQRTAGVISNALYKSRPDVRMGRIKVLEAKLRRYAVSGGEWEKHLTLRLAYENQMLEAQGGRAAHVEMVPGGWIIGGRRMGTGERQIVKVNKSPATGRVVSVLVRDNEPSSVNHYGNPYPDGMTKILSHTIETERLPVDAYRPPTVEELEAFHAAKKAAKAAAPKVATVPLINPTDADAERLQAIWNERAKSKHDAADVKRYGKVYVEFKPATVTRIRQETYSAASKGSYARAETRGVRKCAHLAPPESNMYNSEQAKLDKEQGPAVCNIRITRGSYSWPYPQSVIILTDKKQSPLPASVWQAQPEQVEA